MALTYASIIPIIFIYFLRHFLRCQTAVTCNYLTGCAGMIIDDTTTCNGELSCDNCVIGGNTQSLQISCGGEQSCTNSDFYNVSQLKAYGGFALTNSTFYQIGTNLTVYAVGYFTSYNTTIYCLNGSYCSTKCTGACAPTDSINCMSDETSTCYTDNKYHEVQKYGNLPQYYHNRYLYQSSSINYLSNNSYLFNNGVIKSNMNDLRCDTSDSDCESGDINITLGDDYYSNLYCTGFVVCQDAKVTVLNAQNDTFIICSGIKQYISCDV